MNKKFKNTASKFYSKHLPSLRQAPVLKVPDIFHITELHR